MSVDGTILRGERVTMRPLTGEDLPSLAAALGEPGVREWWWGYDEERLRAETLEDPSVTSFAIENDGELVGLIMYTEQLDPYYKSAAIDVTLDAAHVGRGLGSDAIRTVCRYLIEERGHHRITMDPILANERAIAAYKKVGFKPVGVMRRYDLGPDRVWRDALLMDLLAEELT